MHIENSHRGFRPIVSEMRPINGWVDVEVRRNDVDNHDAALEALKYDVMTG